jgi:hypothetical protein
MLLFLTILMSESLASRLFFRLVKSENVADAFGELVITGGLFQTILWVLYAHT